MPPTPAGAGRPVDPPALTVAAVARRLGVAPATLRTWDRRYGLGPSHRTAGSHRRYTQEDLARLDVMRRLTQEGVSPAEAARVAVDLPVGDVALASVTSLPPIPPPAKPGHGGGRVVPLPQAGAAARGLARAAMALDAPAVYDTIRQALDRRGVVDTWDSLLAPVLVGVGQRWESTGRGVDVEHLLSECVLAALHSVTARLRDPRNPRPVLMCSAEDEQHALPVHALAAALAERHVAARILGARVPRDALAAAVLRSGPAAVFVWSQLRSSGDPAQLADLPRLRPAPALVVGGPGWVPPLPQHVTWSPDLTDAVTRLVAAAGA